MDQQTLFLAGFVAQATFTLTLGLLAFTDRRALGMRWLAAACCLQFLEIAARPFWQQAPLKINLAAGACLIVMNLFLVYMGTRWFVMRRRLRSARGPMAISASMVAISVLYQVSVPAGVLYSRAVAAVLIFVTAKMLFTDSLPALRTIARVLGVGITWLGVLMIFRAVVESHRFGEHPMLIEFGRTATMISISAMVFSYIALYVAETQRRLHDESRIDALTGLRNRRSMEETAQVEVRESIRTGQPLAILMMDIDHFKRINDTWGHSLGDRALRAVGGVLLTVTGADDRVGRMGGEEFAMLLPGRDIESVEIIAERLRTTVAGLRLVEGAETVSLTVSIGVGLLHPGETHWTEMLRRADAALYRAKRNGRNRVELGPDADERLMVVGGTETQAHDDGFEWDLVNPAAQTGRNGRGRRRA